MVFLLGIFVLAVMLFHRDRIEEMRSQAVDRVLLLTLMGKADEPEYRELDY